MIKTLNIAECKEGDILASDILNNCGVALALKDTIINAYILDKLLAHGIESVKIHNETSKSGEEWYNSYTEAVVQTKNIFQELISGKPIDYRSVSCIADKIFNSINEHDKIIQCLKKIQNADEYTYTHSVNVAFYSMLAAKWFGLSDRRVKIAVKSGLLHDIGKTKIPNEILNKKGILTKEEFEVMKEHTVLGYNILKDADEIDKDIKTAVLLHHERIDGSGYPYHFYSDNLNIYSRIVAIADVFDAMTSDRVYKVRATPFEVFEMFRTVGVGIFDTGILNTFLNKLAGYLVGTNVLLSNGETGKIAYIPLQDITKPIIEVKSEYYDLSQENKIKVASMLGYT